MANCVAQGGSCNRLFNLKLFKFLHFQSKHTNLLIVAASKASLSLIYAVQIFFYEKIFFYNDLLDVYPCVYLIT